MDTPDYSVDQTCPIRLLVRTALGSDASKCVSFPDFCRRTDAWKWHPAERLGAFVKYLGSKEDPNKVLSMFSCLRYVDQAEFPYIEAPTRLGVNTVSSYEVRCLVGDFTDLVWLANIIQHRYSVNWDVVARVWKDNYVTQYQDLLNLLSVCPDKRACLIAMNRGNLRGMLNEAPDARLARDVVREYPVSDDVHWDDVQCVIGAAVWGLVRAGDHKDESDDDRLRRKHPQALLWAAKHAQTMKTVIGLPKEREEMLLRLLRTVSCNLCSEASGKVLHALWSGCFASLLRFEGAHSALKPSMAGILAECGAADRKWPSLVNKLIRVRSSKVDGEEPREIDSEVCAYIESAKHDPDWYYPSEALLRAIVRTSSDRSRPLAGYLYASAQPDAELCSMADWKRALALLQSEEELVNTLEERMTRLGGSTAAQEQLRAALKEISPDASN